MFHQGFQRREKKNPEYCETSFLLLWSVTCPLMKHDKRVTELTSQTNIPIDLLNACFTDLYL